MKPLTMTEEDECKVRDRCAGVMPLGWTGAARDCQSAWAEVDALRAKLAEVEAQRDEYERKGKLLCCDYGNALMDTARAQAEARALREVLELIADGAADPTPLMEYAEKALATAPGDDAALRELVMRAVCAGEERAADSSAYHGCTTAEEAVRIRAEIVDGICGPKATDASEGGGA